MFKKNFKSFILLALVLVLGLSVVGCGKSGEKGEKTGDKSFTIGYASSGLNHPFQIALRDGVEGAAKEADVKIIVVDAQDDPAKQISSIEDLIQQEVDIIIINPVDSDAIITAIETANKADIPVITVDRGSNGGKVITHIASDNVEGAKLAAEYIAKEINEKGKVVEIQGQTGASAARDRGKGFNDGIGQYSGIENVYSQPADWDRNKAMNVMENALQSHPDIVAVFAHNDEMALGAMRAVESAGLKDKILVVGFDAIDEAVDAVKAGDLAATVEQQPKLMGKTAVEKAVEYLNSKTELPEFIPVDLQLITK